MIPIQANLNTNERTQSGVDGANWTVATGGSSANGGGTNWTTIAIVGVVGVVLLVMMKGRK